MILIINYNKVKKKKILIKIVNYIFFLFIFFNYFLIKKTEKKEIILD